MYFCVFERERERREKDRERKEEIKGERDTNAILMTHDAFEFPDFVYGVLNTEIKCYLD